MYSTMKKSNFCFSFICCFGVVFWNFSQEDENVQQQLELFMEQNQSEDIDLTLLIDQLDAYKQHPLDLNTATYATLLQFPLITEFQLKSLIKHREENGKLLSVYELQSVKYWDTTSIERILPYVTVEDKLDNLPISWSNLVSDGQLEFVARTKAIIEKNVGFENVSDSIKRASNTYYWGDPMNYFSRISYSFYNRVQLGATFEKDAGEPFFSSNPKSNLDFTSIHFLYKGGKYVKALSVGDYHVQIGQGLHCWTSSVFGKTSDAIAIKKTASVLRAHTSSAEYRFMRGVGIDLEWKRFQLAVFSSFKNSDGRIEGDSINQQITSLLSTGLHRTNSEISTKGSVKEKIIGGYLRYDYSSLKLGFSSVYHELNHIYNKTFTTYNQFDFRGNNLMSSSFDYSYLYKNFLFFGEFAKVNYSEGSANLHGVNMLLDNRLSLSMLFRKYDKDFQTLLSNGLSEGNDVHNENGFYYGVHYKFSSKIQLQGYVDFFQFPWLKYSVNQPSVGNEAFIQLNFQPTKKIQVYGRYKRSLKEQSIQLKINEFTSLEEKEQQNFRIHASIELNDTWTLRSRVEWLILNTFNNKENGFLMYQDIRYSKPKSRFEYTLRIALFDTDSYNSRIYSYESNPVYVFSNPAYYEQGSRIYGMIQYKLTKQSTLWIRYGGFYFTNLNQIGSGSELIEGGTKQELLVQFRLRLN